MMTVPSLATLILLFAHLCIFKQVVDAQAPTTFAYGYYSRVLALGERDQLKAQEESLQNLEELALLGVDLLIPYIGQAPLSVVSRYLDRCAALQISVYVQVADISGERGVDGKPGKLYGIDYDRVRSLVATFANHPATAGWYTADEPIHDTDILNLDYDEVRQRLLDTRKVILDADPLQLPHLGVLFKYEGERADQLVRDVFDIWSFDRYPFDVPRKNEFDGYDFGIGVTRKYAALIASRRKPVLSIGQAQAKQLPGTVGENGYNNLRLPSLKEHLHQVLFQNLISPGNLNTGYVSWAYYRTKTSTSREGFAYDRTGAEWINDVFVPVQRVVHIVGPSFTAPPMLDLSAPDESFDAKLLLNPSNANERYKSSGIIGPHRWRSCAFLIAINHQSATRSVSFDLYDVGYNIGYINEISTFDTKVEQVGPRRITISLPPRTPVVLNVRLTPLPVTGFEAGIGQWTAYGSARATWAKDHLDGSKYRGLTRVERNSKSTSGLQHNVLSYVRKFQQGTYKIGFQVKPSDTVTVLAFVEYKGEGDKSPRYAVVKRTATRGRLTWVQGSVSVNWNGERLEYARIKVRTESTHLFEVTNAFFWRGTSYNAQDRSTGDGSDGIDSSILVAAAVGGSGVLLIAIAVAARHRQRMILNTAELPSDEIDVVALEFDPKVHI